MERMRCGLPIGDDFCLFRNPRLGDAFMNRMRRPEVADNDSAPRVENSRIIEMVTVEEPFLTPKIDRTNADTVAVLLEIEVWTFIAHASAFMHSCLCYQRSCVLFGQSVFHLAKKYRQLGCRQLFWDPKYQRGEVDARYLPLDLKCREQAVVLATADLD